MRQLDVFQSYFDNEGKFLVGRLRFCNLDGSAASVYDANGVGIGKAIETTSSGRLSKEVFLGNHDYQIFIDKWIGETSLDITDDENFQAIGSCINRYNTIDVEVHTEGVQCVPTIAALRELSPALVARNANSTIICLLGYYSEGDKSPIYYTWDADCTDSDNNGTIIKVATIAQGRWLMIEADRIDVRDFGAMPKDSVVEDSTQRAFISSAVNYASASYKSLHFGGSGYYDVTGKSIQNVTCATGAYLMAVTNTTNTYIHCKDTSVKIADDHTLNSLMCGKFTLVGEELKTSMYAPNQGHCVFNPSAKIRLDTASFVPNGTASFVGVEVYISQIIQGPISFTNCVIYSDGKLKASDGHALSFEGCSISESMFHELNNLSYCTFTRCILGNWQTFPFALALSGGIVDGKGINVLQNVTLSSGRYSNINFQGNVTISANCNLIFTGCSFSGFLSGSYAVGSAIVTLHNCTCNGLVNVGTLWATNSTFNNNQVRADNLRLDSCTANDLYVGTAIWGYNTTCSTCTARTSLASIYVELRNFTASNNSQNGLIVANAGTLTGTCVNIIGGMGVNTTITDVVSYVYPLTASSLKTSNFNIPVFELSTLPIQVDGQLRYHTLNSMAANKGDVIALHNDIAEKAGSTLEVRRFEYQTGGSHAVNGTYSMRTSMEQGETLFLIWDTNQQWEFTYDSTDYTMVGLNLFTGKTGAITTYKIS